MKMRWNFVDCCELLCQVISIRYVYSTSGFTNDVIVVDAGLDDATATQQRVVDSNRWPRGGAGAERIGATG